MKIIESIPKFKAKEIVNSYHQEHKPYWKTHEDWMITTQAHGRIDWGPYKQRKNAKKEHRGTSEINLLETKLISSEEKMHETCRVLVDKLTKKRFIVFDIEHGEDYQMRLLVTVYEWMNDIPPEFLINKINPNLNEVYV